MTTKRAPKGMNKASAVSSPLDSESAHLAVQVFSRFQEPPVGQLAWFVSFAQTSASAIDVLSEVELRRLNREVGEFIQGSGLTVLTSPGWESGVRKEITALARFAAEAITGFLSVDGYSFRPSEFGRIIRHVQRFGPGMIASTDEGDRAAHFVMEGARVIEREGDRIAKCASTGCGMLFVKRKRAEYCSGRCSQRERQRHYRKGLSIRERYEIRHAQYVKDIDKADKTKIVRPRGPRRSE